MTKNTIIASIIALAIGAAGGFSVGMNYGANKTQTAVVETEEVDSCAEMAVLVARVAQMRDEGITRDRLLSLSKDSGDATYYSVIERVAGVVYASPGMTPNQVQEKWLDYCTNNSN